MSAVLKKEPLGNPIGFLTIFLLIVEPWATIRLILWEDMWFRIYYQLSGRFKSDFLSDITSTLDGPGANPLFTELNGNNTKSRLNSIIAQAFYSFKISTRLPSISEETVHPVSTNL